MLAIIVAIICVAFDMLTKHMAVSFLKPVNSVPVIDKIFYFTYVENKGAAFGIFRDKRWIFIIITIIIILVVFYLIKKGFFIKKLSLIAAGLIIGGGIGNLIDRIFVGYVVDFLHFKPFDFFDFAVFNLADSCIVIGTILTAFLLVFREKKYFDPSVFMKRKEIQSVNENENS